MLLPHQIRKLSADLPGYDVLPPFEAALPFYDCVLHVRILAKQDLSSLERTALFLISEAVSLPDDVSYLTGVNIELAREVIASLLSRELITQRNHDAPYTLTDEGHDVIAGCDIFRPEPAVVRVYHDGILGVIRPRNRLEYLNRSDIEKRGLHALPTRCAIPAVAEISVRELNGILDKFSGSVYKALPGKVHDVVKIDQGNSTFLEVDIAAFDAPDNSHIVFRVLNRGMRLVEHEQTLQAMFERYPEILPFTKPPRAEISSPLAEHVETLADQADKLAEDIEELQATISIAIEQPTAVVTPEAKESSPTRVRLAAAERDLERLKKQQKAIRRIETKEHRPLLEKALKQAQRHVVIVAPWITPSATRDLIPLIESARDRGVTVYIGWGMPDEGNDIREKRKRDNTEKMVEELKKIAKRKSRGKLILVRVGNTHEKVLICDLTFMVIGSFNWLSFRGDPRKALRRETSMYVELEDHVRQSLADYREVFQAADPDCDLASLYDAKRADNRDLTKPERPDVRDKDVAKLNAWARGQA